ncbi:MAG: molybdopterin molybdotransferase MoeA [Chitinophagaceae bacterium]|jgi:molybdopterin molybdotransferase|nr:molybdopterin molybdotransferase MoeA [Chitinophagaceae bacterium]
MKQMITVQEARDLIIESCSRLAAVCLPLAEAGGLRLATAVVAPADIPAYPQSGMDGYAFAYTPGQKTYQLSGEVAAGSTTGQPLQPGEAVRIFTGAAVPPGANTVLMQEKASVHDGVLTVLDDMLQPGANVRPKGSEIRCGIEALPTGTMLTPAAIGFLAGIGIAQVNVLPLPRVAVLVTGNELCSPGSTLGYGQVYEANSFALGAALAGLGLKPAFTGMAGDDPKALQVLLNKALELSDIVLMTGGVSVGDYDFTADAFDQCGVKKIFHKIKQKPGKPLLFGTKGNQLIFGLPGNPASVLTCYYMYVLPAIRRLSGHVGQLPVTLAPLTAPYAKPAGLTHFLKAFYENGKVTLLTGQESYKLNSFAQANCLAEIEADDTQLAAGAMVSVYLL